MKIAKNIDSLFFFKRINRLVLNSIESLLSVDMFVVDEVETNY